MNLIKMFKIEKEYEKKYYKKFILIFICILLCVLVYSLSRYIAYSLTMNNYIGKF